MLSIPQAMGAGSVKYFVKTAQQEETFNPQMKGEPAGYWIPTIGNEKFGFSGIAKREELLLMFQKESARDLPGMTAVLSPPKSVSLFWAIGDEQVKKGIEEDHTAAVERTVQYMESAFNQWQKINNKPSEGWVVAGFQQHSSRAVNGDYPDFHLHTHILVREAKESQNRDLKNFLKEHYRKAGGIYRAEISARVEERLIHTNRVSSCFEVRGFDRNKGQYKDLMEMFSRRRIQIEQTNPQSGKQAQIAAFKTRSNKEHDLTLDELIEHWRERARNWQKESKNLSPTKKGKPFTWETINKLIEKWGVKQRLPQFIRDWILIKNSVKDTIRYKSHFFELELIVNMAIHAQCQGYKIEDIQRLATKYIKSRGVIRLGIIDDKELFANKRMYKQEKKLVIQTKALDSNSKTHGAKLMIIRKFGVELDTEGKQVLSAICGKGQLKLLAGITGDYKTSLLRAATDAYRDEGYQVILITPNKNESTKAVEKGLHKKQSIIAKALGMKPKEKNFTVGQIKWFESKKLNPFNNKKYTLAQKISPT